MRKHFLLLFLMALLPLAVWSATATDPAARDSVYSGALQPLVTAGSGTGTYYYALVPHGAADPDEASDYDQGVPEAKDAGTYDVFWCQKSGSALTDDDLDEPGFVNKIVAHIYPKELVYFLTGSTYAVGDSAEISRHYSLASGYSFIGNEKLSDYAKFEFPSNTVDLHLDSLGRFTTIDTYNITALKVVPKVGIPQNYDFRFTSTAVIVVTGKSIANFIAKPVDDQAYTGDSIKPTPVAIYASIADSTAHRALDPANYKVTYGENKNIGAGSGKIIYEGIGNYEGKLEVPFNIIKRALVSVTVDSIADTTYTAAPIEPVLTVKGKDANNKVYTLAATDFTVNYYDANHIATNINVSDTTAVGTLTETTSGNFTFPAAANVQKARFKILPKSLNSEDITIAAIAPKLYTAGDITPTSTVTWTRDTTVINVTPYIMWEYQNNKEVGTATIIAKPDTASANTGAKNYKLQKTSTFDIIPTDLATAHAKIDFKKRVNDSTFVNASYKYIARDIKPGTIDEDGELYVTVKVGADSVRLQQDVDYKIISYGDSVTIDSVGYKGDNKNVSVDTPTKTRGTVTIQGIGNFGKINALAEPINISEVFLIGKKQLRLTAAPGKSTIYGAKPSEKFAYKDNTVEDSTKTAEVLLGGKVTYKLLSYDPRQASPIYTPENTDSVALAITDSTRAYKYVPVWTNLPADSSAVLPGSPKIEGVTYQSAAQKAARANYDLAGTILTDSAEFVINAAKWFIVPDSLSKKYMVTDDAIEISNKFKVYAGSTFETADPVANPIFDVAPVIGRKEADKGENVIVTAEPGVYGSYTVSVLNDSVNGVRKTGYEIECLTGKLTILPFPITITANDQTVLYGGAPNTETKANSWIRTVNADGEEVAGNLLTVTYSPVMFGNQSLINRDSLGLTLEWDSVATVSATPHADALIPHITNTNFAPTYVNGSLTVIAGNIMVLGRTDATCKDVIIAHDGVDSVTVKFEDRELKAETWQAMAFPFPVSVAEFSNAIYKATNGVGYAVVNILDEDNNGEKPAFKLWMREIEANQPFLFKVYTGKTGNDLNKFDMKDLEFKGKKITYAEQAESEDARGNKFFGIYETTTLVNQAPNTNLYWLFSHKSGKFSKYTGNSRTIDPMTGYLKTATEIDAFARITVVEEDGTVTAISTINADGEAVKADGWYTINGVKLQGMPTEKGVYIQNGKKVVLK